MEQKGLVSALASLKVVEAEEVGAETTTLVKVSVRHRVDPQWW